MRIQSEIADVNLWRQLAVIFIFIGLQEGNVLFNDALNTFYLWIDGIEHMVNDHSDSERKCTAATWATLSD